jgi:hypothetical protein
MKMLLQDDAERRWREYQFLRTAVSKWKFLPTPSEHLAEKLRRKRDRMARKLEAAERDVKQKREALRTFLEAHQFRSLPDAEQLLECIPETATDEELASELAEELETAHARLHLQEHVGELRDLFERFVLARAKAETQVSRYWELRGALYRLGIRDPGREETAV